MAERRLRIALEFRDNALRQRLAKLDTPLVERVNVPDSALGENAMLVKGHELAKRFRREPLDEDSIGRSVSLEDPVGNKPIRSAFGLDFFGGLAKRQGLGLGEDIG